MKLKKPSTQATHTHPMLSFFSALFSALFFFTSAHADNRGSTRCDLVLGHYNQISEQLKETCKSAGLPSYIPSCIRKAEECESAVEGAGGIAAVVKSKNKRGVSCFAGISASALKEQKKELKEDLERLADQMEKYRREEREYKKDIREEKKDADDKIADLNKEITEATKEIGEVQKETGEQLTQAEKDNKDTLEKNQEALEKAIAALSAADKIYADALAAETKRCSDFADRMLAEKIKVINKRVHYESYNARGASLLDLNTFRRRMKRHCMAEPEYNDRLAAAAAARKSGLEMANGQVTRVQQKTQEDANRHAQAQSQRQVAGAQSIQTIQARIASLTNDKAKAAEQMEEAQEDIAESREQSQQEIKRLSDAYRNKEKKLKKIEAALDRLNASGFVSSGGSSGDKNPANILSIVEAGDEYHAVKNKVESGDCGSGRSTSKRRKKRRSAAVADDVRADSADGAE